MTIYPQIRTSADLLKSTIRIDELIPFLRQQKAKACAIVNTKLYGLLPFWQEVKQANIHPVVGLKVEIQFHDGKTFPAILYAQTTNGYKNLLKITSSISIRDDETLPYRWLLGYSQGLVIVLPLMDNKEIWLQDDAIESINQMATAFSTNLFFGISRPGGIRSLLEEKANQLSNQFGCKIIALHECLFQNMEDHFSFEVAQAIETGVKLNERVQPISKEHQYVPTAEQWTTWFHDRPEWLNEAERLLLSFHVEINNEQTYLPRFPLPEGVSAEDVLYEMALIGLKERFQGNIPNEEYLDRLRYELSIINSMGYADYFLIVSDFMKYAHKERILTGPGRGSSASSLVAYALQITQVDPIKYGLLFERFLNPERISLPDIDIDFVDTRRNEVIEYVAKKYGTKHVAQIITFGTLSAKAVARDVARMFNFESETLEMISKLIPNKLGITLKEAYASSEKLRNWIEGEEIRKRWFSVALKLEGLPRNSSTHAAGVILSPVPLVEVVPIEKGHDDIYLTQWSMQEVEKQGLLKMDFLGLRNLTILEQIRKSIQYTEHVEIDFNNIPLNDQKTYELLQQGDTTGIFQLESEGMQNALREIKPTQILDIVAVNALYRPGPMEFISTYARRKANKEPVIMPHPVLESILKETYGIIVYQEQIMQIAHVLAGFTFGQADLLRRAVSKKKLDILNEQKESFVTGSIRQGFSKQVAEEVYDLIVRFANYGFAKSHAVAYSLISYQMAYLKANYPVHFYAALMTNSIGNPDKIFQYILEAKNKGIEIERPSIQKSYRHFVVENGKIRCSLSIIKGVSQNFLKKLLGVRQANGKYFEDIFELATSLSAATFTRKEIEPLIKAGALDDFGKDRACLLATIDAAIKHAKIVRPTDEDNLFSSNPTIFGKPKYIDVDPIPEKLKLQFEKEVLGFYLSLHPVTIERQRLNNVHHNTRSTKTLRPSTFVTIVGMVDNVRQIRTKKGELMAFLQISDEFGVISTTIFPKEYNNIIGWIKEDIIVLVEGTLEYRFDKPQIIVKSLQKINE
ncbi:DNA polymerase III subunit alpha [Ureibacillus acetophenoni]|uniref:DNA-directed DNA polymerase n=1 Tax=Ureibacillus acetophenoni TaxID=614649 RepID=A0A285U4D3_9BACL|nr:DNA polymerase III subunit alpha [Ureibacillus acetophenoni]SOC36573.1 DNA polymerase-3 subunit alpha [Ureibacillus acetophenoni]